MTLTYPPDQTGCLPEFECDDHLSSDSAPARARTTIIVTPAPDCPTIGFASVRPLIATMLVELGQPSEDNPSLARIRPELVFLFPGLKDHPAWRDARPLADIAVGPSRRRLHKESEQIFRVTQAIVRVILDWAETKTPAGLDIVFHDLAGMDEQSIRVFARLSHCTASSSLVQVSARIQTRTTVDRTDEPALRPFLRRAALREALIARLRQEVPATIEDVPSSGLNPLPVDARGMGQTEETTLTRRFLASLAEGEAGEMGANLLAALEASVFTQNYDHAQWMIEQASPDFGRLNPEVRREILVHLGMLHAFTMNFPLALAAMEASGAHAETRRERAESCFFAGLLLVKRMNRVPEGRAQLYEALAHVDNPRTADECCERAWIYNVLALSHATEKDLKTARDCCRKVLANLKAASHTPDATHIKINVISNITMLDEYGKDIEGALNRWRFFDNLVVSAGPIFSKHYSFREGGLLVKAGRLAEATECLSRAYADAESVGDVFYGDVIARGLAGISYRLGDYAEAACWYRKSLQAKATLIEDTDTNRVTFALALTQTRAGEIEEARRTLATLPMQADGLLSEAERELEQLQQGHVDAIGSTIEAWAVPLPETKLNRPFKFTNLY